MTSLSEQLKKAAAHMKLSSEEKERMRLQIETAMRGTALPNAGGGVRSPYGAFSFFSLRHASGVFAGFAAALAVLGGTAYASEGALPGDPLYAVKINITEPVSGALAMGPQAKAVFHAEIAQRRVEEAETLAARGKLTTDATAQVVANFDTNAAQATSYTQEIALRDVASAEEISTQFDAVLSAHQAILTALAQKSNNSETDANSNALVLRVQEHRGALALLSRGQEGDTEPSVSVSAAPAPEPGDRNPDEGSNNASRPRVSVALKTAVALSGAQGSSSTTPAPAPEVKRAASAPQISASALSGMRGSAVRQVSDAHALFSQSSGQLESGVSANLTAQIEALDALIAQGDAAATSSPLSAYALYKQAMQGAVTIRTYLIAGTHLNDGLLQSLLIQVTTSKAKGEDR